MEEEEYFFFRLPYWKDNLLRHNLDVMHVKKNVIDNILGIMLDIKGKIKDNTQARHDLQEMGGLNCIRTQAMTGKPICHQLATRCRTMIKLLS